MSLVIIKLLTLRYLFCFDLLVFVCLFYELLVFQNQPFHAWEILNLDFSRAMCKDSFNGWLSDPDVSILLLSFL